MPQTGKREFQSVISLVNEWDFLRRENQILLAELIDDVVHSQEALLSRYRGRPRYQRRVLEFPAPSPS